MKKEQRFKVGETVTFRNRNDLPKKSYHYGGGECGGTKGVITRYISFAEFVEEWSMTVKFIGRSGDTISYNMLESEFVEYDSKCAAFSLKNKINKINFNY